MGFTSFECLKFTVKTDVCAEFDTETLFSHSSIYIPQDDFATLQLWGSKCNLHKCDVNTWSLQFTRTDDGPLSKVGDTMC